MISGWLTFQHKIITKRASVYRRCSLFIIKRWCLVASRNSLYHLLLLALPLYVVPAFNLSIEFLLVLTFG